MAAQKISICLLFLFLIAPGSPLAETQTPTPTPSISQAPPSQPNGAPVRFADETLFLLYDKLGPFTPTERARSVTERLERLDNDRTIGIYPVTATDHELTSELMYGDMVLMTVTDRDAQPTGKSRQELAMDYAHKIQAVLTKSHEQVTMKALDGSAPRELFSDGYRDRNIHLSSRDGGVRWDFFFSRWYWRY